jgi:hypothetical protein
MTDRFGTLFPYCTSSIAEFCGTKTPPLSASEQKRGHDDR